MEEFLVRTEGNIFVEAENREEAEEKSHGKDRDHEIISREALPLDRDEDVFKIKLSDVGSNKASRGHRTLEDQSALRLAFRTTREMSEAFVGSEAAPSFKFDLACLLLSELEGDKITGENIMERRDEFKDKAKEQGMDALDEEWSLKDGGGEDSQ